MLKRDQVQHTGRELPQPGRWVGLVFGAVALRIEVGQLSHSGLPFLLPWRALESDLRASCKAASLRF